jgi:ribosomal protein S18 acetylase RimI-like enzyme
LSNFQITRVALTDADLLLSFSKKVFFDAFSHMNKAEDMAQYSAIAFTVQQITSELNNPDSVFYFAFANGVLAGYVKLNFNDAQTEFRDTNALEVERIYVATDYYGKQIGKQLLNFAIAEAQKRHFKYVWLGVWEHNYKAISFYERNGFTTFSSHEFLLGNDLQIDVLMKRPLLNPPR